MASKKKTTIITSIATILLGGSGALLYPILGEHYELKTREIVREEIQASQVNKTGGFRTALSEEIGVKPELIPHEFGKTFHIVTDSIEQFRKAFLPMLIKLKAGIDVGLKANKDNDRIMYLHTNGEIYRALLNTEGYYYFVNDQNQPEYCR